MNVDCSNCSDKGVGFILCDPDGHQFLYAMKFVFPVINNEVEYESLLPGLQMAQSLKITHLLVQSDSQVAIEQVTGDLKQKKTI